MSRSPVKENLFFLFSHSFVVNEQDIKTMFAFITLFRLVFSFCLALMFWLHLLCFLACVCFFYQIFILMEGEKG